MRTSLLQIRVNLFLKEPAIHTPHSIHNPSAMTRLPCTGRLGEAGKFDTAKPVEREIFCGFSEEKPCHFAG